MAIVVVAWYKIAYLFWWVPQLFVNKISDIAYVEGEANSFTIFAKDDLIPREISGISKIDLDYLIHYKTGSVHTEIAG
ncbi:hypothetical protein [Motilimonas sp. 1_MG-2023]|uniref:hypothetical protein n=1 Tax=Motilimonas TaxID=1914248 RepID=UPI0026E2D350|nr:hypothetical protein [Motilimonas sp. 1_MG-2023]MDO6528269.1 hypothetical protein [Motilimonas sp. 1_MG-2023]